MDFLCEDYERAEQNRDMVKNILHISAYLEVEAALKGYPTGRLPYWMYEEGLVTVDMNEIKRLMVKYKVNKAIRESA